MFKSRKTSSTFIKDFDKRKEELKNELMKAEEVNKALKCIAPISEEMHKAPLHETAHIIPKLFQNIWVMWWVSPEHYRNPRHLKEIIKKIADSLEDKCKNEIQKHIDNMFTGEWTKCIEVVENSVNILEVFKTEFVVTQKNVREYCTAKNLKECYPDSEYPVDWDVLEKEQNDMFAQMKNFVGRCNNLFEICECISQFMVKT